MAFFSICVINLALPVLKRFKTFFQKGLEIFGFCAIFIITMVNRVDFQRVFNYGMEAEERRKRQSDGQVGREEVRVDLSQSQGLRSSRSVDYEDLSRKVEDIRRQLESGDYQVSPEKILQGLEKFLSSK